MQILRIGEPVRAALPRILCIRFLAATNFPTDRRDANAELKSLREPSRAAVAQTAIRNFSGGSANERMHGNCASETGNCSSRIYRELERHVPRR